MIKHINHQNFLTTEFVATKKWKFGNVENDDVVLLESTTDDVPVAYEYIDYTTNPISINTDCDIALEQQDADVVKYQEGMTGSGIFYPDSELKNQDGSFKRLVYDQTKRAFYNKYGNPTQMFGMEFIDFPLSKTERNLSNLFRMFTIPRNYFGEKIVGNTVYLYDNNLDDNIKIRDDGFQNLIAGHNLFSKVQEVRGYNLPESFLNIIMSGSSDNGCPTFNYFVPATGSDGVGVHTTLLFGAVANHWSSDSDGVSTGFLTGSLMNGVVVITGSDANVLSTTFNSGILSDLVYTISASDGGFTGSNGASVVSIAFAPTGSILSTIAIPISSSDGVPSTSLTFQSGSAFIGAVVVSGSETNNSGTGSGNVIYTTFLVGSLNG